MTRVATFVVLSLALCGCQSLTGRTSESLCKPLRAFVASTGPDVRHELVFFTSWGGGFHGDAEDTLFAKACRHESYPPAKAVCDYLMEHGAVEFASFNATRAISCLSKNTRFASGSMLEQGQFQLSYGTSDRGAHVTLSFTEDTTMGAMALRVVADGY